ncbi:uncharacterized protein PG986_010396 [Apiospora aurea]|uniref:Uncharacterized protein n=1 Tax=Apiospora aurea TaxID=335848 RepID=A0ABR1Q268_9PEZI
MSTATLSLRTYLVWAGHVVPILDTFNDIERRLSATDVSFPGLPGRQPDSEAADSASLPPRYAPYRPQPSSHEIPIVVSDNETRIVFELFSPQNTEAARVSYRHKDRQPDLMVCSPPLLYALRSVIRYYPELELTKEFPMFGWPYPALVHHYDELKECAAEWGARRDDRTTCLLKRDIPEHVQLLLEYLDTTIMAQVNEEKELNRRGIYTFGFAWVSQKPGTTIVYDKDDAYLPRRPAFPAPPHGHSGDWPGTILSPGPFVVLPSRSDAPVAHLDVEGSDDSSGLTDEDTAGQLLPTSMPSSFDVTGSIESGSSYWDVVPEIQCRRFKGFSADYPRVEIDSIVVIDHQQALKEHPHEGIPPLLSNAELAAWYPPRCPCDACNEENQEGEGEAELNGRQPNNNKEERDFEDYGRIEPGSGRTLTPHQCLLCPSSTWAFVLNTRSWQKLPVRNLRPLTWRDAPMDELVMDEAQKRFIIRLVEAQRSRSGLVLHLYGGPGLGKTFTAGRTPLETLSSSDVIDNSPVQHKASMMDVIRGANRWKTILHFVDADGLLTERASSSAGGGGSSCVAESFRGGEL